MPVMLVIDDDPLVHRRFQRDFESTNIEVLCADTAAQGLQWLAQRNVDLVMLDVLLPDLSGLETFQRIHRNNQKIPVIFITAGSESATAIEAMKLGAYDYLLKPLDRNQVRSVVQQALEIRRLMETPVKLPEEPVIGPGPHEVLVGRCAAIQEVYKAIGRVASRDVNVLIIGESGTGKELVARAIYQHSLRANGPFLAINCAAIPESLLESELFGHEKGAFTGADQRRIGKFEQCSGGTLFLDEIGDMSPSTQSKILRLIQEQKFERIGGSETITTNVRLIAATHRDLERLSETGRFRLDLFYRLNVFMIYLPPVRERMSDLPLLLQHFLTHYSRELHKEVKSISPAALDVLMNHDWPGNVREFQSVIKRAILVATGPVLLPEFLQTAMRGVKRDSIRSDQRRSEAPLQAFVSQRIAAGTERLYDEAVEWLDRVLLTKVLEHTRGNKLRAAKILGVTRATLRNKMNTLGIRIQHTVDSEVSAGEEEPGVVDESPDSLSVE